MSFIKSFYFYIVSKINRQASILMYHSVGEGEHFFTVNQKNFNWQMCYLHKNKYNVVRLNDLIGMLRDKIRIPPRTVVITFDDGYGDNYYNVFPVLKKYNFPATVFLITGEIGGKHTISSGASIKMLNLREIREMWNSGLVDFEPHTVFHKKLPNIVLSDAKNEIKESVQSIENFLEKKCLSFAYPFGRYNETIIEEVKKNFTAALSVDRGFNGLNGDMYRLKRNSVDRLTTKINFWLKI